MDCSHLAQTGPSAEPDPYANPNPYLCPQSHNTHFVSSNVHQSYTTTTADPNSNVMFHPKFQSQQPKVHSPYAPPPASVGYLPIQFVSSVSSETAYPDPSVYGTSAAGNYVPGALNYAAVNGAATQSSSAHLIWNTKARKKGTKKKKKMKVPVPHAWCDVCKIDCSSNDVLDLHRLGKKHRKNLEKLKSSSIGPIIAHPPPSLSAPSPAVVTQLPPVIATSTPLPVSTSVPSDQPTVEPQVSQAVFAPSPPTIATSTPSPVLNSTSTDMPPQMLSPPVIAISSPVIATSTPSPHSNSTSTEKAILGPQLPLPVFAPSPPVIAASTRSPVSNPTSTDKPVIGPEVVSSAIIASSPPSIATSTPLPFSSSAPTEKPIIGPQGVNTEVSRSKGSKKNKRASSIEEFETKRRKLLESGTSAEDVHVCNICNVVCNSDTVLKSHLTGRKHAALAMKKLASTGVATST